MSKCYLYVFEQKVPRIKIGISKNPKARRAQVEYDTKLKTQIMWVKEYRNRSQARAAETRAHNRFAKYRQLGEYFEGINHRDVKRYIEGPSLFWPVVVSFTALVLC